MNRILNLLEKRMKTILVSLISSVFFMSCINQSNKISELEEHIEELEHEADDIDEDFYIAYSTLLRVDSLLCSNDTDNTRRLIKETITDLGGVRFCINDNYAIDMMNMRTCFLDSSLTDSYRKLRFIHFTKQREAFLKAMKGTEKRRTLK